MKGKRKGLGRKSDRSVAGGEAGKKKRKANKFQERKKERKNEANCPLHFPSHYQNAGAAREQRIVAVRVGKGVKEENASLFFFLLFSSSVSLPFLFAVSFNKSGQKAETTFP